MLLILMVFVEVARGMHTLSASSTRTDWQTMFTQQTIANIVQRIKACQTLAELDALWQKEIGYSVVSESPECTDDQLRADLFDYAREMCYDIGVHCDDVGIPLE